MHTLGSGMFTSIKWQHQYLTLRWIGPINGPIGTFTSVYRKYWMQNLPFILQIQLLLDTPNGLIGESERCMRTEELQESMVASAPQLAMRVPTPIVR
jgi:hypothetical protein